MKKIITTFALIAFAGTFASAQSSALDADENESTAPVLTITIPELTKSASIEVFSAKAKGDEGDDPDLVGVLLTCGVSVPVAEKLSVDLTGFLGLGGGSEKWSTDEWRNSGELKQSDLMIGLQGGITFHATEDISIFAGVMIGVDYRSIEVDRLGNSWVTDTTTGTQHIVATRDNDDDSALDLVYGVYLGVNFKVSEKWAITASYRYMDSNVENEVTIFDATENYKTDAYNVFSIGAKYTF